MYKRQYEITLTEGHNQQIRKMFDSIAHSVVKLKRISIGHVKDDRIPTGAYRELDAEEVKLFQHPPRKSPNINRNKERTGKSAF